MPIGSARRWITCTISCDSREERIQRISACVWRQLIGIKYLSWRIFNQRSAGSGRSAPRNASLIRSTSSLVGRTKMVRILPAGWSNLSLLYELLSLLFSTTILQPKIIQAWRLVGLAPRAVAGHHRWCIFFCHDLRALLLLVSSTDHVSLFGSANRGGSTSLPTGALASAEVGGGRWFRRVQQTLGIVLYFSIH
jgi:hypothetical protein